MSKTSAKTSAKTLHKTPADPGKPDPASQKRVASKSAKVAARNGRAKKPQEPAAVEAEDSRTEAAARRQSALGKRAARRPARQTFLVAASLPTDGARADLRVHAVVMRSAVDALAAMRSAVGPEIVVELTGKRSNRMAKTLGLEAEEVRQV